MSVLDSLQDFLNKDYAELVSLGKVAFEEIAPVARVIDKEHDGYAMIAAIVLSAVGTDGALAPLEARFLMDVMGMDEDEVADMLMLRIPDVHATVKKLYDSFSDDFKGALMLFIVCIFAVDETITEEEIAYLFDLSA